ncbi:MAG: DoxX family membrane protein [Elusimicrobia bacterium]|nr:DoxX family membrane protein [Elusimicrobiota bacterium]
MNEKTRDILGLLARLALGGLFIYSGLVKALSPAEEFGFAIEGYKVLNAELSLWAAYAVPWLELYAGLLLAAGVFTRCNALFIGAALLGFEALLGQAWLRGLPITSCGCFGSGGGNSIGREFAQNLVFLALAWVSWKYGRAWSADRAVETP